MSDNKILTVGRTNGAYGVRGWVRVVPFEEPEILAATKRWFLTDIRGNTKTLEVEELKVHGQMLIARIAGILNKEDADALRGRIGVLREDFPEAGEGEVWAADVIGLPVVNQSCDRNRYQHCAGHLQGRRRSEGQRQGCCVPDSRC